ncbi:hypothetical protein CC202_24130 [Pseudomonas savastanoi]|nr:hypothetical protein CC202_24130 [Pseudomonas savastanoi]
MGGSDQVVRRFSHNRDLFGDSLSLGADSLDSVEFIMRIENAFNIEIQEEEIKQFRTVQNIVDYVSKSKN